MLNQLWYVWFNISVCIFVLFCRSELGRTIWGIVGGEVGGMNILPPPEGKLIVTTTRSHSSSTVNDAISAVSPDEVLRVGGAGHKVG